MSRMMSVVDRVSLVRLVTLVSVVALALAAPAAAGLVDVTVRFDPPAQIVQVGDFFTVNLVADIDLPVVGWGLDVSAVTRDVISPSGPPALGPLWIPAYCPDGDGLAGLAFPDSIAGTDVLLATLTYHAEALGTADLFASLTPGDPWEGFALDPTGFALVGFEPAEITVIPEPAGMLLLSVGMLVVARRRLWF